MKLKYKYNNTWVEASGLNIKTSELPTYTGEYEVTPKVYENKTLQTKNHSMKNDILVKKIPQAEVSNLANGTTLIIGEESLNA